MFTASPEKPGPCARGAFLIYSQSKTRRRRGELATSCCLRLTAPRGPRGFLLRPRRSGGPRVLVPRGIKKESASKAELPPGTAGPRAGAGGQACEAQPRGLGVRCPRLPPRSRPGARGTGPRGDGHSPPTRLTVHATTRHSRPAGLHPSFANLESSSHVICLKFEGYDIELCYVLSVQNADTVKHRGCQESGELK